MKSPVPGLHVRLLTGTICSQSCASLYSLAQHPFLSRFPRSLTDVPEDYTFPSVVPTYPNPSLCLWDPNLRSSSADSLLLVLGRWLSWSSIYHRNIRTEFRPQNPQRESLCDPNTKEEEPRRCQGSLSARPAELMSPGY